MNDQILKLATAADPETMAKTAEALELIERLAPEFVQDVFDDFETISSYTTEKVAAGAVPSIMGAFKAGANTAIGAAAVVGTAVGASLGSHIAADLFDAAKRGLTKSRNYKRIMDANPKLKEEVIDKARLKPAFDALHRFAPDFMSDPLLGGSLLKSMANQPSGNEYQLMEKLIGSRKSLQEIKERQMRPDWKGAKELLSKAKSRREPGE